VHRARQRFHSDHQRSVIGVVEAARLDSGHGRPSLFEYLNCLAQARVRDRQHTTCARPRRATRGALPDKHETKINPPTDKFRTPVPLLTFVWVA
jgi:hypothetical protein